MIDDDVTNIVGVILAGGLSRRMGGGDKTLLPLAGRPILSHVIERLSHQVKNIIINANGDPMRFSSFNLEIVPDSIPDFAGPLAGILAGMEWAGSQNKSFSHILTVAADTPFLPLKLLRRILEKKAEGFEIVLASSGGRVHPVISLWPVTLQNSLRKAMLEEDMRKIDLFTARYKTGIVEFSDKPFDPFFNANTKEEWAEAERLIHLDARKI